MSPPRATTTPCMLIVASARVSVARDARRELCRARTAPTPQNQDRSSYKRVRCPTGVTKVATGARQNASSLDRTMTTRRSAWALILAACFLSVAAGADREPFNGAVHSDSGVAVAEDDGMTETHGRGEGFGDSDWVDIALNADKFAARKSWQSPQYHVDGTYVRLRGWFASTQRVAAGAVVFRLPEEATPMRRETWKVTMKGTDRLLAVGADGVAKLAEDMPAENWMPLAGFAYNSLAAGNATGHVEKPPESDAPRDEL